MRYALAVLMVLGIGAVVAAAPAAFAAQSADPPIYTNGVATSAVPPTPVRLTSSAARVMLAGPVLPTQNEPFTQIRGAVGNDGGGG